MTYKVALCGSQGTGKTQIIRELERRLKAQSLSVVVIESPSRYVKSLGFTLNQGGDWRTQLFSVVHRETRQMEAAQKAPDFILADRFILDEMAYTHYHMHYQEALYPRGSWFHRLNEVQSMSDEFLKDDLDHYWDAVYFKPVHPDFPPEADGDRESAVEYQREIQACFQDLILGHNLGSKVQTLDEDLYAATDEIWNSEGVQSALEGAWA